ncbi:type IX secretion system membrane protein PorP/SprF [Chryseolinea sp. Jin1]|uniref:Type IX secretion system membrane protein PorP/SprF n=2 Tax=Chryseolinea lacunae TaxID=2801331 RepID=A0ABS1KVN9_9BACT|nr:type IX secretion system membrane protein PorP/SprF [Chryseolinea lacunae]
MPSLCLAQDIPLFTQKLTNTFLYNPSVAGNTVGSITLSRRQYWSGVQGAPNVNLLSMHMPVNGYRFGTGLTLYQDNIGVSQVFSATGAFAYHMIMPNRRSFSLGVSAEYHQYRVVPSRVDVQSNVLSDPALLTKLSPTRGFDFSGGVSYYAPRLRAGASVNRLSAILGFGDTDIFYPYLTAYAQGIFPMADKRHVLEPVLNYRSLTPGNHQFEGGLYYTFNKRITFGAAYRTGRTVSVTAAFQVYKNVTIGYTYEVMSSALNPALGGTHEAVVRFDFMDRTDLSARRSTRRFNTSGQLNRHKTRVNYFVPKVAVKKYNRYVKKTRTISRAKLHAWRSKKTSRRIRRAQRRWLKDK